jgi:hypothetical protein
MARHYYRTNVPLPIMILWWVFIGICAVIFMIHDAIFKAPERKAQAEAQATWERQHLNGWRLEQKYPSQSDIDHGIFYDRMEQKSLPDPIALAVAEGQSCAGVRSEGNGPLPGA